MTEFQFHPEEIPWVVTLLLSQFSALWPEIAKIKVELERPSSLNGMRTVAAKDEISTAMLRWATDEIEKVRTLKLVTNRMPWNDAVSSFRPGRYLNPWDDPEIIVTMMRWARLGYTSAELRELTENEA